MSAYQAAVPIRTMARVFGVSPAGDYAWRRRQPSRRAQIDMELLSRIRTAHVASHCTYGAPRIQAELRAHGIPVGCKRVARLMRGAGLVGVCRRKGTVTTRRDPERRPAPALVERRFVADRPDQLWMAGITYVPTWAGFLYLAVVLDACSRRIVGWAMANHLKSQLVLDALDMALGQRRPRGVIHHSDQGSQYTSLALCPLPRGRRAPLDGLRRGRVRQRHVRGLLRDAGMRAARSAPLPIPCRGAHGHLQLHRGLVQPATAPFRSRLPVPNRL